MTKQNKIYLFSSLVFVGGTYLVYRSLKRKQVYNLLIDRIAGGSVTISNKTAVAVLTGQHHQNINSSKPFAQLTEAKKRQFADAIFEAVDGGGTDESALKAEFQSMRDKVAISQVASYYKAKHNETLLDRLEGEGELNTIISIINSKPDVRWLN